MRAIFPTRTRNKAMWLTRLPGYCSLGLGKTWTRFVCLMTLCVALVVSGQFLIKHLPPTAMFKAAPIEPLLPSPSNQGDRGLKMAISTTWSHSQQQQQTRDSSSGESSSTVTVNSDRSGKNVNTFKGTEEAIANHGLAGPDPVAGGSNTKDGRPSTEHELQELLYERRNERIRNVCNHRRVVSNDPVFVTHQNSTASNSSQLKLSDKMNVETPITDHFSLVSSFQTMGCFLNKVASSSLVSAFLLVHGLGPTFTSPHSLVFHLQPRSLEDFKMANSSYFKFMFVRHPMDRMLSCYIDKMIKSPHSSLPMFRGYVRKIGQSIIRKREKEARKLQQSTASADTIGTEDTHQPAPSANQRTLMKVKDVIDIKSKVDNHWGPAVTKEESMVPLGRPKSHQNVPHPRVEPSSGNGTKSRLPVPTKKNGTTSNIPPSFEEFLEFVLSTDLQGAGYDSHWVPYHRYCTPCSVKYDVIGKLETAFDDFNYIWKESGLETSSVPIPWVNRNTASSPSKAELERTYYSSLPRELILRFYEKFRLDFELFDYSINETLLKAGYEPIEESEWDSVEMTAE